jgi:hypothetical protein
LTPSLLFTVPRAHVARHSLRCHHQDKQTSEESGKEGEGCEEGSFQSLIADMAFIQI